MLTIVAKRCQCVIKEDGDGKKDLVVLEKLREDTFYAREELSPNHVPPEKLTEVAQFNDRNKKIVMAGKKVGTRLEATLKFIVQIKDTDA